MTLPKVIAEEIEFLTSLSTYYSVSSSCPGQPDATFVGYSQDIIDRENRIASRKFVLYVNLIIKPPKIFPTVQNKIKVNITIEEAIASATASRFDTHIYRIIENEEYIFSGYALVSQENGLYLQPIEDLKGPELRIMYIA